MNCSSPAFNAFVGAICDHFYAVSRNVSGLFKFALFQEFSYPANALVGRVFIGLNTTIGESVDRFDASLGNFLRIRCVG